MPRVIGQQRRHRLPEFDEALEPVARRIDLGRVRHAPEALEYRAGFQRECVSLRRAVDAAPAEQQHEHVAGMGPVGVVAAQPGLVHDADAEPFAGRGADGTEDDERLREITGKHIQLPQRSYFIPQKACYLNR